MSQHDFEIANQGFPSFRSDLNSGLQALASNSAGATEPSTTYAYQFWYDETTDLLKMRNGDDDAWITLAYFDQTNDEWEVRSAVIQAVDSAGVVIKTDDGTTRLTVADSGAVSINTSLDVDNIKIDGNTISSTDTNGNITLDPNGTGDINLSADVDVTGTVTADGSVTISDGSTAQLILDDTGQAEDWSLKAQSNYVGFFYGATQALELDNNSNLLFNSGFGSVGTAYGCRAWVNFDGTGTVSVREDGNVSSISDNGTGQYTVNFATAMPDGNYSVCGSTSKHAGLTDQTQFSIESASASTTSSVLVYASDNSGNRYDPDMVSVAIFR